jgi:hypothetical protein
MGGGNSKEVNQELRASLQEHRKTGKDIEYRVD